MKEHHPGKIVNFVFSLYEKKSADLKLRLRYENLSQSRFFNGIIDLYLNGDKDMVNVLYKIKQRNKTMGRQKLKRTKADLQKGETLLADLGITDLEKENIFDIIESDLGEYDE